MEQEINLLRSIPQIKRDIEGRAKTKTPEVVRISKQYGMLYFDGPRDYGYGGYKYDGRWQAVARDMIDHFGLKSGDRVLDIGCAKGYLVKDLLDALPGLQVFGVDISDYALMNCHPDMVGRLHKGSADHLPFPDGSFKATISLDAIHNMPRDRVKKALSEMHRLSGSNAFIKVDSYHSPEQKALFEKWVLTGEYHDYPDGWRLLFKEAGYTGDYCWTIVG